MDRAATILAILGAVFVGYIAEMLLPPTPIGRAISFAVLLSALFPMARRWWFNKAPTWRYWAFVAVGTFGSWTLDTWRRGLSVETNHQIAVVVFAFATVGLVYWALRTARRKLR